MSEFSSVALHQPPAHFDKVAASGLEAPQTGGQVVDRAAAPTGEATPATGAGGICMQARPLVSVKRTRDLAVASRPHPQQVRDVFAWRNREERIVTLAVTSRFPASADGFLPGG